MSNYANDTQRAVAELKQENADLRFQLATATDGVRDWKNAHALLKEQFHKQRKLLEEATKRLEEAEKQEPVAWYKIICGESEVVPYSTFNQEDAEATGWKKIYTRPIPPADVAELQRELADSEATRELMAKILHDTSIAIKGPNAELSLHSWHDLAEVAAKNALDAGTRIAELERKLAERDASIAHVCVLLSGTEESDDPCSTNSECVRQLARFDARELTKLLSKAREEGRKEAVPEGIVWALTGTGQREVTMMFDTAQQASDFVHLVRKAMLAAAPSPASLNAKEGGE